LEEFEQEIWVSVEAQICQLIKFLSLVDGLICLFDLVSKFLSIYHQKLNLVICKLGFDQNWYVRIISFISSQNTVAQKFKGTISSPYQK